LTGTAQGEAHFSPQATTRPPGRTRASTWSSAAGRRRTSWVKVKERGIGSTLELELLRRRQDQLDVSRAPLDASALARPGEHGGALLDAHDTAPATYRAAELLQAESRAATDVEHRLARAKVQSADGEVAERLEQGELEVIACRHATRTARGRRLRSGPGRRRAAC
jgi:hypothetical protein